MQRDQILIILFTPTILKASSTLNFLNYRARGLSGRCRLTGGAGRDGASGAGAEGLSLGGPTWGAGQGLWALSSGPAVQAKPFRSLLTTHWSPTPPWFPAPLLTSCGFACMQPSPEVGNNLPIF